MNGFRDIVELWHFVRAIDRTHIEWHRYPSEHHYEYRCYKGCISLIMFAVCTANRRVIYVQVEKPVVLVNATVLDRNS